MSDQEQKPDHSPFHSVPVEIKISIGKATPSVSELLSLAPGTILKIDRKPNDPIELYVADRLFAFGELQEADDPEGLGVQVVLTSFVTPESGD